MGDENFLGSLRNGLIENFKIHIAQAECIEIKKETVAFYSALCPNDKCTWYFKGTDKRLVEEYIKAHVENCRRTLTSLEGING